MQQLHNPALFKQAAYINGQWLPAENKKTIDVINPFNQQVLGTVPSCGASETARAIQAAWDAWQPWRELTTKERSDYLWKWAKLIDSNKDDLARIMTLEQGKPIEESRGEIDYANSFIKWFAEEGRRVYGDVIPSNKLDQHLIVIKQSIGVVAAITPWNFPAAMITRKIAPALAAGCPVVVKPDSATPFSAYALAVLSQEAGIPAGVFNVLTGSGEIIGKEMTSNPLVRKVSFTGSTEVGRLLMQQCSSSIKKITLELGGNAPFIVFDDANLDLAVQGAIACKFRNSGQTCVCANRIYVQDKIYDAFLEKFITATSKLKVGNGLELGVQIGPLINQKAVDKVQRHIDDAVAKGGRVVFGGKEHALGGLFFEPTVIADANMEMELAEEETFGPVAPIFKFSNEEEAVAMSNETIFGLASYFYSQNMDRIWRVSEKLEYGMVGVNTGIVSTEVAPFGGIKQSGIGREGSKYGMDPYLELKYICMNKS